MDKNKALQKLLNGTASKKEVELLKQALASGEISIGGDMNRSVVIIGSGNKVELTAEALGILKPEASGEEPAEGEPPYMGLRYFDTSDADLFFGRQVLTRELAERVAKESFLAIVGASGSGKSSVTRAGLIPEWKKENQRGVIHIFTPTAHPLESLAASLTRESESVTATSTLMDDLQKDSRSLRLYIRKLLSNSGTSNLFLVVDQFEETFTLCKDPDERKAFIENLLSLADENTERNVSRVVLTLRADFYHHCFEFEGLRLTLEKHQANIGAMTQDELREAITAPAEKNGWDIQPGLVDLILQDVGAEPGALPLLSHALLETWKRRQGHMLTLQGYHEAGGVKKAIAQTAESVYDRLSPNEKAIARNIFLRLTELGEGVQDTRRRVKMDELAQTEEHEEVTKVLKTLTDARLVTTEQDSAEVAHEALIREWGTLRKWLDEDRESLRLHRHLTESAAEWERSGRDELYVIHRGGRLDDALSLKENTFFGLSESEESYLEACVELRNKEQREREKRSRWILVASIVASVIFLALASFGLYKSNKAERQAKIALAHQLASQASSIYATRSSKQMVASLLAIESLKLIPDQEAISFLANDHHSIPITHMSHEGAVLAVAFGSDGKFVVSGSEDGTARVWDAATGNEIARLTHDGWVRSVEFSPDGKFVVSGSEDGTARVWDAITGDEVARMTHDGWVRSVEFSPDGKFVVSGSEDGTARVWDAATGDEVARMIYDGDVHSVTFSPDGKFVASGSKDGTARVWDAATGNEIARMTHDDAWVYAVAFSPDGKFVVSGSTDGTARIWDAATGNEIARLTHDGWVRSVEFSPDGKFVVSGSEDGTARVWDAITGDEVARMTHDGSVSSTIFSADSKFVISGSDDGTARVWVATTGDEVARTTQNGGVLSAVFSPDGKLVVSGSLDGTMRIWNAVSNDDVALATHDGAVFGVAFSPDGKLIVSSSEDGTVRVWNATTGDEVARITNKGRMRSVVFSPDGNFIASGGEDRTVRVWDTATRSEVSHITYDGWILSVTFSPDGKFIASGGEDRTVRVWDVATSDEVAHIDHKGMVFAVAFSPNEKLVVSGSEDGARVWDIATGTEVVRMTHDAWVYAVAFSPDGKFVVSGSIDGIAQIWDVATGDEVAHITHDGSVRSVAFSPDGKFVVSGGDDNVARVWDAITGDEVAHIIHDGRVLAVAFSPDGEFIVSGSTDGIARIWQWKTEDVIASACSVMPRNLTRAEWQQFIGDALPYQAVCENLPIEPEATATP